MYALPTKGQRTRAVRQTKVHDRQQRVVFAVSMCVFERESLSCWNSCLAVKSLLSEVHCLICVQCTNHCPCGDYLGSERCQLDDLDKDLDTRSLPLSPLPKLPITEGPSRSGAHPGFFPSSCPGQRSPQLHTRRQFTQNRLSAEGPLNGNGKKHFKSLGVHAACLATWYAFKGLQLRFFQVFWFLLFHFSGELQLCTAQERLKVEQEHNLWPVKITTIMDLQLFIALGLS